MRSRTGLILGLLIVAVSAGCDRYLGSDRTSGRSARTGWLARGTKMTENEIADKLKKAAVPAIHLSALQHAKSKSKIGGLPDVPRGFEWPTWKGKPLAFLAQLDLSAVQPPPSLANLPKTGLVYFFYDQEQSTWGFDPADRGSWRVIHSSTSDGLAPAAAPKGLASEYIYKERPLEHRPIASYPSLGRLGLDIAEVADMAEEAETKLRADAPNEPQHQIGGFPSPVQGDDMELESQLASNGLYCGDPSGYQNPRAAQLEAGATEWNLLLQLDSDDDAGMMWGDVGMLYFWIRTADLAAGDFSKVWMILQCY